MTTSADTASSEPRPAQTAKKQLGIVVSDKRDKSRTVQIEFQLRHTKYGKYISKRARYHVHDQNNESKEGDVVEIVPCRPLSKTKRWQITRVVEAAPPPVELATINIDQAQKGELDQTETDGQSADDANQESASA